MQALPHSLLAGFLLAFQTASAASYWPLNGPDAALIIHGDAHAVAGVADQSLVLDGSSVLELKESAALNSPDGFSISLWFNPYVLGSTQQMLIAKNRYSLDERQWGIAIEADGKLKAYLQQGGWSTIICKESLQAGHWHLATLTVAAGKATLFLNGKPAGEAALKKPLPSTPAPITLGGVFDEGKARQQFLGALDEAHFEPRALSADEVAASYHPIAATHELPKTILADFPLWDETQKLAEAKDLPLLEGVEFRIIKKWDESADGYHFLHGVGLAWHKGRLYASFGHNKGAENTVTEEAQYRISEDDGKTWSEIHVIDAGEEPDLAVSHGVFLSHAGTLWAFHGAYYNHMQRIHTRAYSLDETTGQWIKHGVIIKDGFWALNQPLPMKNGNWIMPGISAGAYTEKNTNPAAVAISHGADFTTWDFIRIPPPADLKMWGESSVIVHGSNVLNIARYGAKPLALIARSTDYGRTWSTSAESNMPMTTSKPCAGLLSNGQRYLLCTTAANNGGRRSPLTIAVSKPGETLLSKVFVIRRTEFSGTGESLPSLSLSYPCAVEHDGKLYVAYSNNGGRKGNLNSAEMAVIQIEKLK